MKKFKRVEQQTLKYYNLIELLKGLEAVRPGIQKRIWDWLCEEKDSSWRIYNGRISTINLFYYGVGDEYEMKRVDPSEIEHSKKIHPRAFIKGKEKELRLDLNLIWHTYEDEITDSEIEKFAVLSSW